MTDGAERTLRDHLETYRCRNPGEAGTVERFVSLLEGHPRCFRRDCWAGHITGSAWLVDAAGRDVLLTHHRKLGIWVQLGGHSDGDPDTSCVARREAEEESGLRVERLAPEIFDLDIHAIPARKADPEHLHFDVRYAFVTRSGRDYRVSDESHDLAWVPVHRLHEYSREESMLRMARKWLTRPGRAPSKT